MAMSHDEILHWGLYCSFTLVSFSLTNFLKSGLQVVKHIFYLNDDNNGNKNKKDQNCTVEHLQQVNTLGMVCDHKIDQWL